ncbi:hypothetical protein [Acrocarpospora catenulata]|uniref:hypothetical protein n=1 Tax=Acrocarpospora catenulata TaxID=2836182 RepID=UPI001BD97CF5|nr:hypothetical protein [Acrocarpospora catenulata]
MAHSAREYPGDSGLRLAPGARERLLAVVLDANAYGRGRPDLGDLERTALRLRGIGIETWVPEPVVWEWAEHLAEDWHLIVNPFHPLWQVGWSQHDRDARVCPMT